MKNAIAFGSGLALFIGAASAQDYDETNICGDERYGEFDDERVYLPNAWNDDSPDDGFTCMSVEDSVPAFDVTWNWNEDIRDVHAYPYVRLNDDNLPVRLSQIESIRLATDWTMRNGSTSDPPRTFSEDDWEEAKEELEASNVQANAAWDFFLDGERDNTYNPVNSTIEVMVWLGRVGNPYWLGRPNASDTSNDRLLTNLTLGDVEFSVYHDKNFRDRDVFTCVTADGEDVNSFDADFSPLFEYILENPTDIEDFPEDPYLGIVEFGSESWRSDGNVTFTAANFAMDLEVDEDAESGGSSGDDDNASMTLGASALAFIVPAALMMTMF